MPSLLRSRLLIISGLVGFMGFGDLWRFNSVVIYWDLCDVKYDRYGFKSLKIPNTDQKKVIKSV